jgi:hypothetical protein
VRAGAGGGVGLKPSDKWAISLCAYHHREQHRIGEPRFEDKYGLDLKGFPLQARFFHGADVRLSNARSEICRSAP